jgi:hypothetical protein
MVKKMCFLLGDHMFKSRGGKGGLMITIVKKVYNCNVPDLASLGNVANVCVRSKVYNI